MLIKHLREIPAVTPAMAGAEGVSLQWIFNQKDGAGRYAMRLFEVKPGGLIPLHEHPDMEHEIFVVAGEAEILMPDHSCRVKQYDALFVKPGERHGFRNDTAQPFQFICVIPVT